MYIMVHSYTKSDMLVIITVVYYVLTEASIFPHEIFIRITQIHEVWHWHMAGMELDSLSINEPTSRPQPSS